jgi:hypothetical protein
MFPGVADAFHALNTRNVGGVAQLVRACGSYPQCPGFKSLHRHHLPAFCSQRFSTLGEEHARC